VPTELQFPRKRSGLVADRDEGRGRRLVYQLAEQWNKLTRPASRANAYLAQKARLGAKRPDHPGSAEQERQESQAVHADPPSQDGAMGSARRIRRAALVPKWLELEGTARAKELADEGGIRTSAMRNKEGL
jgi:hypothetical protein